MRWIIQRSVYSGDGFLGEVGERELAGLAPCPHLGLRALPALVVQATVSTQIEGLRREGETRPARSNDVHHPEIDVLPDLQELVPFVDQDVGEDLHVQGVGTESDEPDPGGCLADHRVCQEELPQLRQDVSQLIGRRLVAQSDGRDQPHLIASCEVLELDLGELRVGNAHKRAIEGTDPGRA